MVFVFNMPAEVAELRDYCYAFLLLAFAVCFMVPVASSISRFGVEGEYMSSRIQAFLSSLVCLFMVASSYCCFIEG